MMYWEIMIFNLLITTIILSSILFPIPTSFIDNNNDWDTENISKEKEIEPESINFEMNEVENLSIDLDGNGTNEEVNIKSHLDSHGDQKTEIYIDSKNRPIFTEAGSFFALNVHKMNTTGNYVTELQLQTGQSLNTLFYSYHNRELTRLSVSTENPPLWHGIMSRNFPEFKDIDNDGELELLAYYHFLYDHKKTVEVYKYNGNFFELIQKYEESV